MQLTIEHIQSEMEKVDISPRQVADYRLFLAALYSLRAAEMGNIEVRKAQRWLSIRKETGSVAEADRTWDATADGVRQIELKWELRRIEKLTQALASKLRVMENEARNIV